jgi:anti-sigma-K factor RskA
VDIKAYIASGVLEHYLLGLLGEAEQREVEKVAAEHAEVREALHGLEDALASYAATQAAPLPEGFLGRLMARIDAEQAAAANQAGASAARPGLRRSWGSWVLAACLALLAGWFYTQWQQSSDQLSQEQIRHNQLKNSCEETASQLAILRERLNLMRDTATRLIQLPGTAKAPDAAVAVYFNAQLQKTILDVRSLPLAADGRQYQLWALVDGQPVSLGVFEQGPDAGVIQEVNFIAEADAFAITLEPDGGLPAPTLSELYVIGEL